MVRLTLLRATGVVVALALALSLAPAAFAGAEVGTFHFEEVVTDPASLPECMPAALADMVGTQDGFETTDGHFSANATGFHFAGTTVFSYRVDFPDGRYVVGAGISHFTGNFTASGETLSGEMIREPRTIYDPDGQVIGRVLIHAVAHLTYRDADGNGQPDPGEITVEVSRFAFTCR
jgi:hypothetical protein